MNIVFFICLALILFFAEMAILAPIYEQLSIIASGRSKGRYKLQMRTYQHCIDELTALKNGVPECDKVAIQMAIDSIKEIKDERTNREKHDTDY